MSVTLNTSTADPRVFAAAQDETVWRRILASAYESHEPYTSSKLSGDPIALVWTNDRLEAVPTTNLPHRDQRIVGYLEVQRHRILVYRSDLDVSSWAAWLTDYILAIDIAEGFPVADQIYDSEILEEANL